MISTIYKLSALFRIPTPILYLKGFRDQLPFLNSKNKMATQYVIANDSTAEPQKQDSTEYRLLPKSPVTKSQCLVPVNGEHLQLACSICNIGIIGSQRHVILLVLKERVESIFNAV